MKSILIIENFRFGREFLIRAKKLGYKTILATNKNKEDITENEHKYIDYLYKYESCVDKDIADEIVNLHKSVDFDGVIAGHVGLVPLSAIVSEKLGLPSFGVNAAISATNKNICRSLLRTAGMFEEEFYEVKSLDDIYQLNGKLNYPLILKPIDGFSSINVRKIESFTDLLNAFKNHKSNLKYTPLKRDFNETLLLESFIEGKEYSVESIIENGEVRIITITEKRIHNMDSFIESGHIIPSITLDDKQKSIVNDYVKRTHKILKIKNGLTHTEVIVNGDRVDLIEINPRIGGGYLADALGKAFNIDLYEIAVKNSIGEKCNIPQEPICRAFVGFAVAEKKGRLTDIEGIDKLLELENIEWVKKCHSIGDEIVSIDDNRARICAYLGFSIEPTFDVLKNMKIIEENIRICIE